VSAAPVPATSRGLASSLLAEAQASAAEIAAAADDTAGDETLVTVVPAADPEWDQPVPGPDTTNDDQGEA
jgi:hypothetical protein